MEQILWKKGKKAARNNLRTVKIAVSFVNGKFFLWNFFFCMLTQTEKNVTPQKLNWTKEVHSLLIIAFHGALDTLSRKVKLLEGKYRGGILVENTVCSNGIGYDLGV